VCWGLATHDRTSVPNALSSRTWVSVDCGGAVTCAMDDTARLECWGANVRGQATVPQRQQQVPILGNQTAEQLDGTYDPTTFAVTNCSNGQCIRTRPYHWLSFSVGYHHACGVFLRDPAERVCGSSTSPGKNALCWGDYAYDQDNVPFRPCGKIGTETCSAWKRTAICENLQWSMMSAGGYHSCAISRDDETGKNMIKCWGLVDDGQIGYVNGQVVLIAAGGKLQFDGRLMMMMMALSSALLAFWR